MVSHPLPGIVLERDGAAYRIETAAGEVRAVLSGRTKRETPRVVVGDRVQLTPDPTGELYAIAEVEPRRTLLERRVPLGRGTRPIAANIDTVFVVTSNCDPAPVPQLIDRLLVVAESNEIAAAVVINKVDLDPGTGLEDRFRRAGYPVFRTSAKTGEGLEALRAAMAGRESVVTGPSGAGKSSLLNALHPGLGLRTGELSLKVRRGRNTTVSARMLPFEGGYLVDTPGFNEVGLWGIEPRELASCFPEFRPYLGECRFQDCRHLTEPGCKVQAAVGAGAIAPDRLESYRMLLAETVAEPEEWE
jgi:ribosome biogenesis GTPase / thiamine phosphate phosphatase